MHYSEKFVAQNFDDSEYLPVPILDFASPAFDFNLRAAWRKLNAVIICLPLDARAVKAHLAQFEADLAFLGEAARLFGQALLFLFCSYWQRSDLVV